METLTSHNEPSPYWEDDGLQGDALDQQQLPEVFDRIDAPEDEGSQKELQEYDLNTAEIGTPSKQLLSRASEYPLLEATEEVDLAKRIERGDLEAKAKFINSNLRLVASIAARYQGQGVEFDDLLQEGVPGLIRAVEKFDWRRGLKFSTYATFWIGQAIQRGLHNTDRTIRIPTHKQEILRRIHKSERRLVTELGREPTPEEISQDTKIPLAEVETLLIARQEIASLNAHVSEETELGDLIADKSAEDSILDTIEEEQRAEEVRDALSKLSEDERKVIELRFGIEGGREKSVSDTALTMHMGMRKVKRIEEEALERLRGQGGDSESTSLVQFI